MSGVVGGVFVGGASTRMGRRAKGLLLGSDGRTLVERCSAILRAAGAADVVLVGEQAAYAPLGLRAGLQTLADRPAGIGPLGGIIALLEYAGPARAVAVACDMPFVSESLLKQLLAAPDAPVVAPRRALRWEPLCARYDARVLPFAQQKAAAGDYSLQRLLEAAGAVALVLPPSAERELQDWDTPDDVLTRR